MSTNPTSEKIIDLIEQNLPTNTALSLGDDWPRELATKILQLITPNVKEPSPALIEAAYVAQDSLSNPPDQHTIAWAAEIIESYLGALDHTKVHVIGHDAASVS